MSDELMPRMREALNSRRRFDPLGPRLPIRVQRAVDREAAWGLAAAARAQAAGFAADARLDAEEMVTERAMVAAERLNRLEAAMAKHDPVQAERVAGLVDDFLMIARLEIRRLSKEF
jgi:hypothetical protein